MEPRIRVVRVDKSQLTLKPLIPPSVDIPVNENDTWCSLKAAFEPNEAPAFSKTTGQKVHTVNLLELPIYVRPGQIADDVAVTTQTDITQLVGTLSLISVQIGLALGKENTIKLTQLVISHLEGNLVPLVGFSFKLKA